MIAYNYEFLITDIKVYPMVGSLQNVIGWVKWNIVFTKDGFKSVSEGETYLENPDPTAFVDVSAVSKEDIKQWVIAKEGGKGFIDMLSSIHAPILNDMYNKTLLVNHASLDSKLDAAIVYNAPLRAPVDATPIFPTPYTGTIPVSTIG